MIAGTAEQFVAAGERALELTCGEGGDWLAEVDLALADMSWDTTQARMAALLAEVTEQGQKIERPAFGQGHLTHTRNKKYDYLIVGCGFAGSVLAERLATQHGARILMIDKRDHVAGNAYDEYDKNGILYHKYGPHIFHANSDEIVSYLSQFTQWRPYEHRVLANVRDQQVPIPINRTTLNKLFDAGLKTDEEAAAFLAARAEPVADISTSEDVVINASGASSTSCSSRATPASSGASTRRSSTSRSPAASRRGPIPTTATSPTRTRSCRCTATPRCSRRCSTIR
jgi:UDP-galactopyranose mutase